MPTTGTWPLCGAPWRTDSEHGPTCTEPAGHGPIPAPPGTPKPIDAYAHHAGTDFWGVPTADQRARAAATSGLTPAEVADQRPRAAGEEPCSNPRCPLVRAHRGPCAPGAEPDPGTLLVRLSEWIDAGNAHRDPEARTWGRIAKIGEECGEAIEAFLALTGQNPRKGVTGVADDVVEELLDVAVTALGAIEHLREHDGRALDLLATKIRRVAYRAGLTDEPTPEPEPVAPSAPSRRAVSWPSPVGRAARVLDPEATIGPTPTTSEWLFGMIDRRHAAVEKAQETLTAALTPDNDDTAWLGKVALDARSRYEHDPRAGWDDYEDGEAHHVHAAIVAAILATGERP